MRLLAVSTWCPTPAVNGSKVRALHLLRVLSRQHQVRLITFAGPEDDPDALGSTFSSVDVVRANPFLEESPGLAGLFSLTPRSVVQTFNPGAAELVAERVADCHAAIAFQIPAAAYLTNSAVPVLLDEIHLGGVRDRVDAARGLTRLRRRLTWWKARMFTRKLAAGAAAVTVASEAERSLLAQVGCDPSRITIVANGADPADQAVRETVEPDTLVYPGSLTYDANLDAMQYLIGAILPRVRRAVPGVTLRISGDFSPELAAALPAAGGVVLTGRLADVAPLIARSAICVVPLRRGEGTRVKILQALALGTPVVSTKKGAEGLAVTDGEDVLLADEPEAFAAHVVRLLEDHELRRRLSGAGRDLVRRRYTWEQSAAVWLDAIETLGSRPRPA